MRVLKPLTGHAKGSGTLDVFDTVIIPLMTLLTSFKSRMCKVSFHRREACVMSKIPLQQMRSALPQDSSEAMRSISFN